MNGKGKLIDGYREMNSRKGIRAGKKSWLCAHIIKHG